MFSHRNVKCPPGFENYVFDKLAPQKDVVPSLNFQSVSTDTSSKASTTTSPLSSEGCQDGLVLVPTMFPGPGPGPGLTPECYGQYNLSIESLHLHHHHIPQYRYKRTSRIQCINCGILGHTAKKCNEPVTSYGIICYRRCPEAPQNIQYLMIQKKDSLSYVEFVRGKYDIANRDYMIRLANNMTPDEKQRLRQHTFDDIWQMLWANDMPQSKRFISNFHDSKKKFEHLKKGFFLKLADASIVFCNLDHIIESSTNQFHETEWEFPKGRRQVNECDEDCAIREFTEEAGMKRHGLLLHRDMKPFEEVFVGINRTRYRHVYYVGTPAFLGATFNLDRSNAKQCGEVRDIAWLPLEQALEKTRLIYVERKELLMRVHRLLTK